MAQKLLNTEEAADYLCVSKRTLENWRQLGIGPPFVKLPPKLVRYREAALEDWVIESNANEVQNQA